MTNSLTASSYPNYLDGYDCFTDPDDTDEMELTDCIYCHYSYHLFTSRSNPIDIPPPCPHGIPAAQNGMVDNIPEIALEVRDALYSKASQPLPDEGIFHIEDL